MTDEERTMKFDATKKRVLDEMFGPTTIKVDDNDDVEVRVVDSNWNSGKSWMSQLRETTPMNNDMTDVGKYNELLQKNNGVVMTQMRDKPGFNAPVVK